MAFITVTDLGKVFKRRRGRKGLGGAVKDLFKREYDTIKAVDGVSFAIEKGEVVGYVGPNGAGKSTTMKILCGILVPTSGRAEVGGIIPYQKRELNARRMGVVFGQRTQLSWDLPLSETFDLMKHMYDIPESRFQGNIRELHDVLGTGEFVHAPVRQLSLGQRMRAELACALLHDPDVLYLDEPTIGLDVIAKINVRDFLVKINQLRHTTILLATHDMTDIEKICSRTLVIHKGQIMYDGSLDRLKNEYGADCTLRAEISNIDIDLQEIEQLHPNSINLEKDILTVKYDKNKLNSAALLRSLADHTLIKDFNITESSIEDIIKRMYQGYAS
jgi:ABC-2 type transport system ATP-binding protein